MLKANNRMESAVLVAFGQSWLRGIMDISIWSEWLDRTLCGKALYEQGRCFSSRRYESISWIWCSLQMDKVVRNTELGHCVHIRIQAGIRTRCEYTNTNKCPHVNTEVIYIYIYIYIYICKFCYIHHGAISTLHDKSLK